MKTIYMCSDTVTGIFSAVYDAWRAGGDEESCGIAVRGELEQQLFCEYVEVEEAPQKACAVETMIKKHLGMYAYSFLYHASLSSDRQKADAVLNTMRAARGIRDSKRIMDHLSHPAVAQVFKLSRNVEGEAHSIKGFLRFQELKNKALFARIDPVNQVLTCLAPHFADRFPLENWMIYDSAHQEFAVHEAGKKWVLLHEECLSIDPEVCVSDREQEIARLWREFCQVVSVEARESKKRQIQNLPLRYRLHMPEFGA